MSLNVDWYAASKTFYFDVAPNAPGCSAQANGTQCTETIEASIGNVSFTLVAYDGALNASGVVSGNELSRGSVNASIVEGKANTVQLAVYGTPAKMTLSIPTMPSQGVASSVPLNFTAYDAGNYAIAGHFSTTVAVPCVTDNSYSLGITVNGESRPWIDDASDQVMLTYAGYGVTSTVIHACANGSVPIGSVTVTPSANFGAETLIPSPLTNGTAAFSSTGTFVSEPSNSRIAYIPLGTSTLQYFPTRSGAAPLRTFWLPSAWLFFTQSSNAIGWLS